MVTASTSFPEGCEAFLLKILSDMESAHKLTMAKSFGNISIALWRETWNSRQPDSLSSFFILRRY